jgi:flagellar motor component MotA
MDTVYQNIADNLLTYLVGAVALIIIAFALRHWRALGAWIKAKKAAAEADTKQKLQALLWSKALEAYLYAETAFAELEGSEKMNKALQYVSDKLALLGISFSPEEIRAAIEKAWYEYEGEEKKKSKL